MLYKKEGNRRMNRRIRKLWIKGLSGSADAYCRLGILFLNGLGCRRDRKLAGLCLRQAAELGSEEGYLLYHKFFSKGKRIIDNDSYVEIYREYERETDEKKRRKLRKYLNLGTKWQKLQIFLAK
ncbi:MAG: SEL1-like repeat protein [Lachnospiraceae bacterium]|nr:SEL1-like repeat protein [Lachnospiraceae bacterium]